MFITRFFVLRRDLPEAQPPALDDQVHLGRIELRHDLPAEVVEVGEVFLANDLQRQTGSAGPVDAGHGRERADDQRNLGVELAPPDRIEDVGHRPATAADEDAEADFLGWKGVFRPGL